MIANSEASFSVPRPSLAPCASVLEATWSSGASAKSGGLSPQLYGWVESSSESLIGSIVPACRLRKLARWLTSSARDQPAFNYSIPGRKPASSIRESFRRLLTPARPTLRRRRRLLQILVVPRQVALVAIAHVARAA